MHHLSGREPVKPGGRGIAVGTDILRINQFLDLKIGKFFGLRNRIQSITGLAKDGTDLGLPLFEGADRVLAMIKNDP